MPPLSSLRLLLFFGAVLLGAGNVRASTFVVTSTADTDGNECGTDCTLRQAIHAANRDSDEDTIVFDESVFATRKTIAITKYSEWIDAKRYCEGFLLDHNVNIIGPDKPGSGVTIEAPRDLLYGVFNVSSFDGQTVNISNLTVRGGQVGLRNGSGNVSLRGCTFTGQETGIINAGTQWRRNTMEGEVGDRTGLILVKVGTANLTLNNCTICDQKYKGLSNYFGTATINSCTIANNDIGIEGTVGDVYLANTLVVGNKTSNLWGYDNSDGTRTLRLETYGYEGRPCDFHKTGKNITRGTAAEAGLDPNGLQNNGGPTPTIALVKGSPAVDGGETMIETDQRGIARTIGTSADIGAFEYREKPMGTPSG